MTTIIQQLADALRKAEDRLGVLIECDNESALHGASPDDEAAYLAAKEALAAYDGLPAKECADPDGDAATAERLLGLADQFLEDWQQDDGRDADDGELAERKQEWAQWRPRILACVNACQGIPTELLESLDPGELDAAVNDGARDPSHPMLGR